MREVGFQQVMVVPFLTTVGLGILLYAQNISFTGPVGFAAPIVEPVIPAMRVVRPLRLAAAEVMGIELPLPGSLGQAVEENETIKATSQKELMTRARENSGREDPFIPLLQPDPSIVVPPPIVALPMLDPLELPTIDKRTGKKLAVKLKKRTVKVKVRNAKTGQMTEVTRVITEPVFIAVATPPPTPPPIEEPAWSVTGILSTGHDTLAIIVAGDVSREARVGDILEDNSRVLDITPQTMTLYKNGKKFVKTIGESK
ncbi:MAG TPA: hypothetical protein DD435_03945 [Cyanobacteria bacterium UBA8530]|nr:hypothetical protein [Cyanobacteria bacterium UBA8530]